MTATRARALLLVLALLTALCLLVGATAHGARGAAGVARPKLSKVSVLYVVDAGRGTLRPARKGGYRLTLSGLGRDVVWFSDRPARRSGTFPTRGFVDAWKGFGFLADRPNAALVYDDRTAVVELGRPRLAKGRLSFRVRPVARGRAGRNLAAHARVADPIHPGAFRDAALFVDNAQGLTYKSCLFEPFTVCENLLLETGPSSYLEGIDLRGAKLTAVEFGDSNMRGANLKRVSQEGGEWQQVELSGAELQNADLGDVAMFQSTANRAEFREADLAGAQLQYMVAEEADFRGSELRGADLSFSRLWRSNFGGAELAGASFEGASFDETIMPAGWICNNREGPQGCAFSK